MPCPHGKKHAYMNEFSKCWKGMETPGQLVVWIPRVLLPQWNLSNSTGARHQTVSVRPYTHRPMSFCRGPIGCDRRSRSSSCDVIAVMYYINVILSRHAEIAGQIVVSFSACWVAIWHGTVEGVWRGILESWAVFLMVVALLSLGFSAVFSTVFSAFACCSSSSCSTECSGRVADWVDWWAGWVAGWVTCRAGEVGIDWVGGRGQ